MALLFLRMAILLFLICCIALPLVNRGYDYIRSIYWWMFP